MFNEYVQTGVKKPEPYTYKNPWKKPRKDNTDSFETSN